MQFFIPRDTLLACLHRVVGILDRKQALPVLSHVLIHIQEKALAVKGTDSEVELVAFADLPKSQESCAITLPGRKLYDICRALPEGCELKFTLTQQLMQVSAGRSRFSLQTIPATDFPTLEDLPATIEIEQRQGDFRLLLEQTQFAMAQQDVRFFLNGLSLAFNHQQLTMVASDGHRLAMAQLTLKQELQVAIRIIMPRRGALELIKLLTSEDETMTLAVSVSHLRIKTKDFDFTSRLINASYPDHKQFFPKNADKSVIINSSLFKQALQRAAILANDKVRGIRFDLTPDLLTLSCVNQEQEASEESLPVQYQGENLSLGFNLSYFLDVLQVLKGDTIQLLIGSGQSGVIVESTTDKLASYLVMPLTI